MARLLHHVSQLGDIFWRSIPFQFSFVFTRTLLIISHFFFHSFQGKMLKNCQNYTLVFEFFSFGPPLETKKKSCLNWLKFCEVSQNPKFSICWKFQMSISKIVGCPHFCMVNISNWGSPLLRSIVNWSVAAWSVVYDW